MEIPALLTLIICCWKSTGIGLTLEFSTAATGPHSQALNLPTSESGSLQKIKKEVALLSM